MPKSMSFAAAPAPASRHDDVLGLDVAVDDAALVGVGERLADVGAELGDLAVRDIPVGRQLGERRALDELAHEEAPGRRAPSSYSVTIAGWLRRAAAWASRSTRPASAPRDLLDGDLALEALVEGAVDRSHATRADALEEAEAIHHHLTYHSGLGFRRRRTLPAALRKLTCGRTSPVTTGAGVILSALKAHPKGLKPWHSSTRKNWHHPRRRRPPSRRGPIASDKSSCAERSASASCVLDPDPARPGHQGLSGRTQAARLRELRLGPERGRVQTSQLSERLLRAS